MNLLILKVLSVFFIVFFLNNAKAQIKIIEINASALVENKNIGEYSILIYIDGQLKDSVFCKKTNSKTLSLESEKLYSIVFKKASFPEKIVIVDTKIPSGLRELIEEPFELQVELSKISTTLKQELTDYPVAILTIPELDAPLCIFVLLSFDNPLLR